LTRDGLPFFEGLDAEELQRHLSIFLPKRDELKQWSTGFVIYFEYKSNADKEWKQKPKLFYHSHKKVSCGRHLIRTNSNFRSKKPVYEKVHGRYVSHHLHILFRHPFVDSWNPHKNIFAGWGKLTHGSWGQFDNYGLGRTFLNGLGWIFVHLFFNPSSRWVFKDFWKFEKNFGQ